MALGIMGTMHGLEPNDLMLSLSNGLQASLTAFQSGNMELAQAQITEALQEINPAEHRLMFAAHYLQMRIQQSQSDNSAVRHGLQLLAQAEALNRNDYRVLAHAEIGELYRQLGMHDRAIRHLRESLRYTSSLDAAQMATPFLRLGLGYLDVGNYADALVRLERARNLFYSLNNHELAATALLAEANALNNLGRNYDALNRLETAESLILKTEDRKSLTAVHRAMARAYAALGKSGHAEEHLTLAQALHEQGLDQDSAGLTTFRLAEIHFENGDLDSALADLELALQQFRRAASIRDESRTLRLMSQVHEAAGHPEAALKALKDHLALRKELESREGDRVASVRIMQLEQSLAHEHNSARSTQRALVEANRELRARSSQLEQMSRTDPLTGLYNRRHLAQLLEDSFRSAPDQPLSFMIFDVDEFKNINDTYGHATGDQVLIQLSRVIQQGLTNGMVAARWGGEEFAVAMPGTAFEAGATRAEALLDRVQRHNWSDIAEGMAIRVSAGLAARSESETRTMTLRELIKLADDRMYTSKQDSRALLAIST